MWSSIEVMSLANLLETVILVETVRFRKLLARCYRLG